MDLELLYENARRIIIYQKKELMLMAVKISELEKKLQSAERRVQASEEKLKIERAVRSGLQDLKRQKRSSKRKATPLKVIPGGNAEQPKP